MESITLQKILVVLFLFDEDDVEACIENGNKEEECLTILAEEMGYEVCRAAALCSCDYTSVPTVVKEPEVNIIPESYEPIKVDPISSEIIKEKMNEDRNPDNLWMTQVLPRDRICNKTACR